MKQKNFIILLFACVLLGASFFGVYKLGANSNNFGLAWAIALATLVAFMTICPNNAVRVIAVTSHGFGLSNGFLAYSLSITISLSGRNALNSPP